MKTFEILYNETTRFNLTITPTRVTIKVPKHTYDEDVINNAIKFLTDVANSPEMLHTIKSMRGRLDVEYMPITYIQNNKDFKYSYRK